MSLLALSSSSLSLSFDIILSHPTQERDRSLSRLKDLLDLAQANLNVKEEELKQAAQEVGYLKDSLERQRARHADEMRQLQEGGRAELRRLKGDLAEYKTHLALYRESAQGSPAATIEQVLYNWYFLQAFNFHYFHAPNVSAKITSFI